MVASVLLGLVPVVADPFLSLSVEAFDRVSVGAFAGSLFGVLVLVAAPVLLLGAVSPWAIRLKLRSVEGSGETAGRMYAISTVGSLVGTFASSLLLIPLVGTQRTFQTFALLCALVAVPALPRRWLVVPLLLAVLIALPKGTVKAAENGRVVDEAETEYQYARVIDRDSGDRVLELNEGQAVHSLYRRETVLTGDYWDTFLVDPLAVLGAPPRRVAMLGNAGGTAARAYARYFPATRIDAVELDAAPERDRAPLVRAAPAAAAAPVRPGRPAVPAADRGALRRDLPRRLPPALRPLVPHDARVLRPRRRSPGPGRRGDRQRRPPRGLRRARAGADRDDAHGLRPRGARPGRADEHDARRVGDRAVRRPPAGRRRPAPRGRSTASRAPRPPASRRGSAAARSTPTTARRWSG